MVALVREWGGGLPDSAADPQPIPIPATIPAGHTLVLSIAVVQAEVAVPAISDTAGNTWGLGYVPSGGSTTRHVVAWAKITNPLTSSDEIIVDITSSTFRFAWCVTEWDDWLNVSVVGLDDPPNGTSVASSAVSCPDDSLLLSCVVLRNPARIPTAVAPTQITTKYVTLAEGTNRATWQQYRIVTTAATVSTESTLDVGGGFSLYNLRLVTAPPPPPSGWAPTIIAEKSESSWLLATVTEWNGADWVPATVLRAE